MALHCTRDSFSNKDNLNQDCIEGMDWLLHPHEVWDVIIKPPLGIYLKNNWG